MTSCLFGRERHTRWCVGQACWSNLGSSACCTTFAVPASTRIRLESGCCTPKLLIRSQLHACVLVSKQLRCVWYLAGSLVVSFLVCTGLWFNWSQVLPTTTPVLCVCNRCLTPQLQALAAVDHNTSHGRCIPPVCVLTCLVDAGLDAAAGKLVF